MFEEDNAAPFDPGYARAVADDCLHYQERRMRQASADLYDDSHTLREQAAAFARLGRAAAERAEWVAVLRG